MTLSSRTVKFSVIVFLINLIFCSIPGLSQENKKSLVEIKNEAHKEQLKWVAKGHRLELLLPKSGIALRLIPPGEFTMGSPESESKRSVDEAQKTEKIDKAFYMSKYEITQQQWLKVMGTNPSHFKKAGLNAPVENVNWHDCEIFLKKLSKLEGANKNFRLPSDKEWEYACRAGTKTTVYSGNFTFVNDKCPELDAIAWYSGNSNKTTHPVGLKKANAFGLYDTIGNVWEWTSSWYSTKVQRKVTRGGPWNRKADYCRAAKRRSYFKLESRSDALGLRIVMEIP